jgi:hypothetical protein
MRPNAWIIELGPVGLDHGLNSAPRRDRASVALRLVRLKSCPQGQLNYLHYPFPGPQHTMSSLPATRGDGECCSVQATAFSAAGWSQVGIPACRGVGGRTGVMLTGWWLVFSVFASSPSDPILQPASRNLS